MKKKNKNYTFKEFKKFLIDKCWDEKLYGDGKYDHKIYNWFEIGKLIKRIKTKNWKEDFDEVIVKNYRGKIRKEIKKEVMGIIPEKRNVEICKGGLKTFIKRKDITCAFELGKNNGFNSACSQILLRLKKIFKSWQKL